MKIGLRGGHSQNCKGAIGLIDEQAEVRKIYNELVPTLQAVDKYRQKPQCTDSCYQ